jgi:hypothetical protein
MLAHKGFPDIQVCFNSHAAEEDVAERTALSNRMYNILTMLWRGLS